MVEDSEVVMDVTGYKIRSVFDRYDITSEANLQDFTVRVGLIFTSLLSPAVVSSTSSE